MSQAEGSATADVTLVVVADADTAEEAAVRDIPQPSQDAIDLANRLSADKAINLIGEDVAELRDYVPFLAHHFRNNRDAESFVLDLEYVVDDEAAMEDLVFLLRHNHALKHIEFVGREISPTILKKFIEALSDKGSIETLNFSALEASDETELWHVVDSFKSLRQLNIRRLYLEFVSGPVAYAVLNGVRSAEELEIEDTDSEEMSPSMQARVAEVLASFLSRSQSLVKLRLNDDAIGLFFQHLVVGFIFNQSIQELDLFSNNPITAIEALHLDNMLDRGSGLKYLTIGGNFFGQSEFFHFCRAVGLHPSIVRLDLISFWSNEHVGSQAMLDVLLPDGGHLSELILPVGLYHNSFPNILSRIPPNAFESIQSTRLTKICFAPLSLEQANAVIRSVANGPLASLRYMDMIVDERFGAHLEHTVRNLAACLSDNPVLEEYCRFRCHQTGPRMQVIFKKFPGWRSAVSMTQWEEAEDQEECARYIMEWLNQSGIFCSSFETGGPVLLDYIPQLLPEFPMVRCFKIRGINYGSSVSEETKQNFCKYLSNNENLLYIDVDIGHSQKPIDLCILKWARHVQSSNRVKSIIRSLEPPSAQDAETIANLDGPTQESKKRSVAMWPLVLERLRDSDYRGGLFEAVQGLVKTGVIDRDCPSAVK